MIKAERMSVINSEWKMYWTPAAPKWDMAPTYVKQVLFPDYHGAEHIHKSAMLTEIDDALDDGTSSFEAVDKSEENIKEVPLKLRCDSEIFLYFTTNIPEFTYVN